MHIKKQALFLCLMVLSTCNNYISSTSFTNSELITINDLAAATPYPSTITVSGYCPGQVISHITLTLNGLTHTFPADLSMMLVAPNGNKCVFMSNVGGGDDVSNITVTFDDAAATTVPNPLEAGTFKPTTAPAEGAIPFPAPAPQPVPANYAQTEGTATFTNSFNGINPNGSWDLYILDAFGQDAGFIAEGWTLTISPDATPAPTISLSANQAVIAPGESSTLTATVGSGTPPYSVEFSDGFVSPVSPDTIVTHQVNPTSTTTYSATVTDFLGCISDTPATITVTVGDNLKVVLCGPKCRVSRNCKPKICGKATPGSVISLFANTKLVAKTKANAQGCFCVTPCRALHKGCNSLVAVAQQGSATVRSNALQVLVKRR